MLVMLRAKASELRTRTLFLAPVFSWVKLCSSAGGAMSALARQRLLQPPAPVPLDSARLLMALPGRVRTCALGPPSEGGLHLADLADGGCGVQGK